MRELNEIEHIAERCRVVAGEVESALRTSEYGWIVTAIRTIRRAGPAVFMALKETEIATQQPAAKAAAPAAETATPAAKTSEGAGTSSPASGQKNIVDPELMAQLNEAIAKLKDIESFDQSRRESTPQPQTKRDETENPFKRAMRARRASAQQPPPSHPLEKLRELLGTPTHPIVVSALEASELLEHVRHRVLPQVEVIAKRSSDYDIRDSQWKVARLLGPERELDTYLWAMVYKLVIPTDPHNIVDPRPLLHLADLASPVLRGIGAACWVLPDLSEALVDLVERIRMNIALDRAASAVALTSSALPSSPASTKPRGASSGTTEASVMGHSAETEVDFAILTVIDIEREAALRVFGLGQKDRVKRDGRVYWRGRVLLANGEFYTIVVAQPVDMANVDTAVLVSDVIRHWKPTAALLVGIAAKTGAARKVELGDVVIGTEVYYYERGKETPAGLAPEPKMLPADSALLNNAKSLTDWEFGISVLHPLSSHRAPTVHYGVIASGEKVIADAAARERVTSGHRKIIAIDMEGYGFFRAVLQSNVQVRPLVIRGICDEATESKGDDWHEYAAAVAAGVAKYFLEDRPLDPKVAAGPPNQATEPVTESPEGSR